MLTPGDLLPLLKTARFGHAARYVPSTESTNTLAAQWAANGASEGSLVMTDYQQGGRGRLGRSWQAPSGKNLLCSLILYPHLSRDEYGLLSIMAATALAEALAPLVDPLHVTIKWPNDLLLEGKKCCGILLESALTLGPIPALTSDREPGKSPDTNAKFRTYPPSSIAVILGIGLNVNQVRFPEELEERATSLLLETGRTFSRVALLATLLDHLEERYLHVGERAFSSLLRAYELRLESKGEEVLLYTTQQNQPVQGKLLGIDKRGALRLLTAVGEKVYHAGEITSKPTAFPT